MRQWFIPALAALLLLNGCSWIKSWGDDDDPDAPTELVEFEPTLKIGKVWSASVGSGLDKAGRQLRPAFYPVPYTQLTTRAC